MPPFRPRKGTHKPRQPTSSASNALQSNRSSSREIPPYPTKRGVRARQPPKAPSSIASSNRIRTSTVIAPPSMNSQSLPPVTNIAPTTNIQDNDVSSIELSSLNEITMAIEMHNDHTLGCAFFSFGQNSLQVMEDVTLGGIEVVEQLLVYIEPTSIITPLRIPEVLESFLTQYCKRINSGGDEERVVLRSLSSSEFSYNTAMNSLGSIYERCNGKAKVLFSTSNLAGYDSASLLRLSSVINPESRISIGCAGAVVSDIRRRCEVAIITNDHEVSKISMFTLKDFMFVNLDSMVSLQIINSEMHPNSLIWGPQNPSTGSKESLSVYGLFHSLASSSLGKLKLRKLFLRPVLDMHVINQRQQTIGLLVRPENQDILYSISKALRGVKNIRSSLEQLKKGTDPVMGRGSSDNGVWGTVQKFCSSVTKIREIVSRVSSSNLPPIIQSTLEAIHSPNMHAVGQMISRTVNLERSQPVSRAVVAEGVDTQLDELRRTYDGMESLLNEAAQHMIGTIPSWARDCISNCIFYPQLGFLTVIPINPDTNTARYSGEGMPDSEWEQMFAADGNAFFKNNAMRELDAQFGDMYSMISDLEIEILHQLSLQVIRYEESLVAAGDACAELDCMIALALGAQKYGWTQPTMTDENVIQIKGGRHPLQELVVPVFISNDCNLAGGIGKDSPTDSSSTVVSESGDPPRTLVITGPNHSGKSVYLKHVALIVYLAHIGSFVPAKSAVIGITDKILTRISTRESAGQNQSAFTIDLQQIAFAARMATRRSLVLVDEFGKGTRADDGAALLAALIDHFAAYGVEAPKMIVATHFHEIIQGGYLKSCPGINLAHMEVRDMKDKAANNQDRVIYLYQLQEGPSLSSFGAICASLNGVDDKVVQRAEALMASMSLNKDLRSVCSEMTAEEQFKFEVAEEAARGFLRLPLDSIDLIGDKTMHATDVIRGLLQDTLKQRVGDE